LATPRGVLTLLPGLLLRRLVRRLEDHRLSLLLTVAQLLRQVGRRAGPSVLRDEPLPPIFAGQTRIAFVHLHRLLLDLAAAIDLLLAARLHVDVAALQGGVGLQARA